MSFLKLKTIRRPHLEFQERVPSSTRRDFAYTLIETLIAFVVLVVFLVLGFTLVFRKPTEEQSRVLPAVRSQEPSQGSGNPEVPSPEKKAAAGSSERVVAPAVR